MMYTGTWFPLTKNPDLSEDLLSETFVSAISSISNFKGQSSVKNMAIFHS